MKLQTDNLGKVSITIEEDFWNINKDYNKLTIVNAENNLSTYISRLPVPTGVEITNRTYWIPIGGSPEAPSRIIEELVRAMREDVVKVIDQTLTEEQKVKARANINALGEDLINDRDFNNIFN